MKHGAGIYKVAKKLNCCEDEIIDFSSNINLYQPELKLKLSSKNLARYADSSYSNLKRTISKKLSIKKSQIALYNGATSAIFELLKHLKEKEVYLYAPLYGEYQKAAKQADKSIYKINRFKNINAKVKKNSIVIFVNPSTPDGKYYDLEQLFTYWKKQNCIIIIDESFLEFQDLKSLVNQIKNYDKLYFIKSFTKFYACAGVRVGAILSQKENIKKFKLPLWNLSTFDVSFLTHRLKDKEFERRSKELHIKRKKELKNILKKSKLFTKVFKSDSNFFLTKSKESQAIYEYLLKQKILVRTCDSFTYLNKNYLRFAVKNRAAHSRLKSALEDYSLHFG